MQITNEIDLEFTKISKKDRNSEYRKDLLNSKTETEVSNNLKKAGFKNNDKIIALLKKRLALESSFRLQNPNFYLLDINKRTEMVNKQYDLVLNSNNLLLQSSSVSTQSCGSDYTKDIGRCNTTYGKCAIVAVIAAVDGIVPSLIVGVFCAWDLTDCREDAKEDYIDCVN